MSKIQDCADQIIRIMTYSDKSDIIKIECKLDEVFEAMLIFLDYEDMIDIMKNRVIGSLSTKIHKIFFDYITNKINYWNECVNN